MSVWHQLKDVERVKYGQMMASLDEAASFPQILVHNIGAKIYQNNYNHSTPTHELQQFSCEPPIHIQRGDHRNG